MTGDNGFLVLQFKKEEGAYIFDSKTGLVPGQIVCLGPGDRGYGQKLGFKMPERFIIARSEFLRNKYPQFYNAILQGNASPEVIRQLCKNFYSSKRVPLERRI